MEKQPYLVCYDYGTGGLWAVVMARSEEEIHREYPELVTVPQRPKWLTAHDYRDLLDRECHDIDGRPWGSWTRCSPTACVPDWSVAEPRGVT
jgi:hypothetical protein